MSAVSPPNHVAPSAKDGQKDVRIAEGKGLRRWVYADRKAYGSLDKWISCLYS